MTEYDLTAPWNVNVKGREILPLINEDAAMIRVEAGPGTGKTFGLGRRILRLLHPMGLGVAGTKVAVVAFNRVIAKQLREDIKKTLDDARVTNTPVIETVHSFCLKLLREDVRILLDHERQAMLYDVLHEYPTIKQTYPRHSKVAQALHDHEARLKIDVTLWQAVRSWLDRHKARLISDLPGLMLNRIRGGDFSDLKYEHLVVDEFQDLTPAEQDLLVKLRPQSGQLVALGDRRQSIYAFLGNDRLGLAKLADHATKTAVTILDVPLSECQRCPEEIVHAANQLMSLSEAPPMKPGSEARAKIWVLTWSKPEDEAKGMAKLIRDNLNIFQKSDHLVMVTRRQFGYWLRDELLQLDPTIAVDLSFSESVLESPVVREAFSFFCLITDPDAPTWRAWFGFQGANRNAPAYLKFFAQCNDAISADAVTALCSESRSDHRGGGGGALWDRAQRYCQLLEQYRPNELEEKSLIEAIFNSDNWPTQTQDDQITSTNDFCQIRKAALEILDDLISSGKTPDRSERLRQVARYLRYSIATRKPFATSEGGKLKVTTLWGAKGLTADHVYVLGLSKEAIPGLRTESYPGTDAEYYEEQRRLFYVSITRSRGTLVLSRSEKIKRGEARKLNLKVKGFWYWATLEMCPFLEDIMSVLPAAQKGEDLLTRTAPFCLGA